MRPVMAIGLGLLVAGCEMPRVAEKFAETPVSTQICSFYIDAATELAQAHCKASGVNAELVGRLGMCEFNSGPGREYQFWMTKYPTLYNCRCVR
jgi:hypothetical protein